MNYYIITYGCQVNHSDSERIATVLEKMGYKITLKLDKANLVVVNMCSIRQSAVDRIFGQSQKFNKLKTLNPKLKTLLTGCILKNDFKKFKNHFDFILSKNTLSHWPKILKEKGSLIQPRQINKSDCQYLKIKPKYSNNFSACVPISIGCNNFCSYCVVPYLRGPLACRPYKNILKEAKNLIKKGFKEIWLLGENVNDYHSQKINFAKLLKITAGLNGNFWLRFTSPNPKDFSDELIDVIAKCKKITHYLNLPVQSGDNKILKRMNRNYTIEKYKNLVKKIRKKIPDITLSTDVIVGFPGETRKQFENTVKLFKQIKFDMAYIAKYSPRPQTTALKLKDNVSKKEKKRREKVLFEILKETAQDQNKKYIGKTVEVLNNKTKGRFLIGKTKTYKTVKFQAPSSKFQNLIGQFVKVKIIDAMPWGLKGELI